MEPQEASEQSEESNAGPYGSDGSKEVVVYVLNEVEEEDLRGIQASNEAAASYDEEEFASILNGEKNWAGKAKDVDEYEQFNSCAGNTVPWGGATSPPIIMDEEALCIGSLACHGS